MLGKRIQYLAARLKVLFVALSCVLSISCSDEISGGAFDPDRVVYQGVVYEKAEKYFDYGRVTIRLTPKAVRNTETNILEHGSPYSLSIVVWSHPSLLQGRYASKDVRASFMKDIEVLSIEENILYQSEGGETHRLSPLSYDWVSERDVLDFDPQKVSVRFTVIVEANGVQSEEDVSVELDTGFIQVRNGDLTGATP